MSTEQLEAELAIMEVSHSEQAEAAANERRLKCAEINAAKRAEADRVRSEKFKAELAERIKHNAKYAAIAERARKAGVNMLWVDRDFGRASGAIGCPIYEENIKDGMTHIEYDGAGSKNLKTICRHIGWAVGVGAMIVLDCGHLLRKGDKFTQYDDSGLVGITGSIADGQLLICHRDPASLIDGLKRQLAKREVISDRLRAVINC